MARKRSKGRLSPDVVSFIPSGDPRADGQRLFDTLFADKDLREAWGERRGSVETTPHPAADRCA